MKIEINGYTKIIKKKTILDNVCLSLNGGTIYGIQGINGSGKTMLLRAICGLIHPTCGYVSIDDSILGKDISFPQSVGVLIENPSFMNYLTGFDNLKVLASIKNLINDDTIIDVMNKVGLDCFSKLQYRKYSLGMKQRLGIAAAVMESPDIVVLDEPFNALDTAGLELAKKLILEQKNRGALVLMTCHNESDLSDVCDELIKMENGRII